MRLVRRLSIVLLACAAAIGSDDARAAEPTVIEIAPPPAAYATDATALRAAAAGEIKKLNTTLMRGRRRVVVSLSLAPPASEPIVCNVNATVRDAKTGTLIAVIQSATRAGGPVTAAQRKELAYSAVRSAVRRVPTALAGTNR